MMAVFAYLWFMMGPVQEVLNIQYSFFGARAARDRINRILDLHEESRSACAISASHTGQANRY
jgi:ATP-binding cassette subfamily C protein